MESAEPAGGLRRWQFGELVLDERTLELSLRGQPLRMHRKPLQVLLHLLQHADEVVTKDELAEACWPGRILSDTVLSTTVKRLRTILGDDAQQIIKTVHGFGYRFVAPVSVELLAAEAPARLALAPGDHPPLRPTWSLVERIGGGGSGEVWRVRQDRTGEQRVFKFAVDGGALRGLKREVTLYRVLHDSLGEHANLLRVLDWNLERAPFFIETEYQPLGSLPQWSQKQGGLGEVPLAQRLALIAQCAELLAAAHRVGVLHKDLKPSNVLVAGDTPDWRIKLGDFGSGGMLDAQRLHALGITRLGFTQTVAAPDTSGTPLYLAPEVLSGQPSTLQSDIYALGVMLYQAVVGDWNRPLAPGWERQVDDETLRDDIAAAVDGDPARRLADAGELARRLRHLDARRVQREAQARAAAEREQLQRRLERAELRRRWALATAAVLVLGLASVLALYLKLLGVQDAREAALDHARDEAEVAHQISDYVVSLFDAASPEKTGGKPIEPRKLVDLGQAQLKDHFKGKPQLRARMMGTVGELYCRLGMAEPCRQNLERALTLQRSDPHADPLQTADLLDKLGHAYGLQERWDDQERSVRAALKIYEARLPDHDPRIVQVLSGLGMALLTEQKTAQSITVLERARTLLRDAGDHDDAAVDLLGTLAQAYQEQGQAERAIKLAAQRVALVRTSSGEQAVRYYDALADQAMVLMNLGHYAQAEPIQRAALAGYQKAYPPDSRQVLDAKDNLAYVLNGAYKYEDALRLTREVVAAEAPQAGTDDPGYGIALINLGELEETWGDYPAALGHLRQAYRIARHHYGDTSIQTQSARISLARLLNRMDRPAEALPLLQIRMPETLNGQRVDFARGRRLMELGSCYRTLGDGVRATKFYDEAEAYFRKTRLASDAVIAAINGNRARLQLRERHYEQALALIDSVLGYDRASESSPSSYALTDELIQAKALLGLQRNTDARALLLRMRSGVESEMAPTHPSRIEFERLIAHFGGRKKGAE